MDNLAEITNTGQPLSALRSVVEFILLVIGGSGGLMFWYDRFQHRPRLRIHSFKETFIYNPVYSDLPRLVVEIENLGLTTTSLDQTIMLHAFDLKGKRCQFNFTVSKDRNLPPSQPLIMVAHAISINSNEASKLNFLFLKSYTLRLTRGGTQKVYLLVGRSTISRAEYLTHLILYKILGPKYLTNRLNKNTVNSRKN